MANREEQHPDDADKVLIRPSTCSTFVVKKSSIGHVPHEPSKGAIGHDVCHSSTPTSASTAAHGGLRVTAKTSESKRKHSLSLRRGELDAVSSAVQCDVLQSSSVTPGHISGVAANSGCHVVKSPVEEYKTNDSYSLYRETAQTSKSVHIGDSSSTVSLSSLVEDDCKAGGFPGTSQNHAENVIRASTSGNIEMLETEVVSLREQLVIQSKVSL